MLYSCSELFPLNNKKKTTIDTCSSIEKSRVEKQKTKENIIFSKINQTQNNKYYMIP